jgi:nicotinamidase-related amidase
MNHEEENLSRWTFLLSTEQHEVLLAFEEEGGLTSVAEKVRRDPSVVSRTLKSISSVAPLLEKQDGKWRITPLGRQFNRLTKKYLETQSKLLRQSSSLRLAPYTLPTTDEKSALLLIGTQVGFLNAAWGPRNNPDAESKIESILDAWRKHFGFTVFCPHLSKEKGSPLHIGTSGAELLPKITPQKKDLIVEKHHNSAFARTSLADKLKKVKIQNVILVGFSTCHCIDATARSAFDGGFTVFIVSDATAAFDRIGPDGKHYSADVMHAASLAALHQEYATVIDTDTLLSHLFESKKHDDIEAI